MTVEEISCPIIIRYKSEGYDYTYDFQRGGDFSAAGGEFAVFCERDAVFHVFEPHGQTQATQSGRTDP
jgi:hypothetical protein